MALTDEEYKALGEAEYMIDDVLVEAAPITFGGFCEKYDFDSKEYAFNFVSVHAHAILFLYVYVIFLVF